MTLIRRFLSTALAASLVAVAPAAQDGKLNIATVDMQELFKQYYRTIEAKKQNNVDFARIQKDANERKAKIRELNTSLENLKKQIDDPSINDSKKQAISKDAQVQYQDLIALDRELKEFQQRRSQALNEKANQRMRGILEEIRKLVEERAKLDNYDYVFDKSSLSQNGIPFLLYTKDATDITAGLLKTLNKDAPPGSLTPEEDPKPDAATPAPVGDK
ncbi:MAG: OmpH family outer membrane protein [Verrucomicrobia bacterium]|nr:OmpH family outer membrane protein [Verrucomicrobiota bacterium]